MGPDPHQVFPAVGNALLVALFQPHGRADRGKAGVLCQQHVERIQPVGKTAHGREIGEVDRTLGQDPDGGEIHGVSPLAMPDTAQAEHALLPTRQQFMPTAPAITSYGQTYHVIGRDHQFVRQSRPGSVRRSGCLSAGKRGLAALLSSRMMDRHPLERS